MQRSDSELIKRCIEKDPLAWAELIHKYSNLITVSIENRLRKYGFRIAGADIEDIRQDILVSIWGGNRLQEVRNRSDISYWLAIVSGNAAVDYMRNRRSREPTRPFSLFEKIDKEGFREMLETIPSKEPDPQEALSEKEISNILKNAIDALKHKERLIVKLYLFFEKSDRDIAKILGLSRGTVSSCIKRTKEKLRVKIARRM